MARTFWGTICSFVGGVAVTPVAAAKGIYEKMNGGSFEHGADTVFTPVVNACEAYGDKNGELLTNTVVVSTISAIVHKVFKGTSKAEGTTDAGVSDRPGNDDRPPTGLSEF